MLLRIGILLAGFAFPGSSPRAGIQSTRPIPAAELRADLSDLRRIVLQVHPSLDRYVPRSEVEAAFDRAEKALTAPLDESAFLAVVSRALGAIRDGHTQAIPSADLQEFLRTDARMIPLKVRFDAQGAFVYASADPSAPLGAAVLAIDGRTPSEIVRTMEPLLPVDGFVRTRKRWLMGEDFARLYWLYVSRPDTFSVDLLIDGTRRSVKLRALTAADFAKSARKPSWNAEDQSLGFRMVAKSTGLLTLPTFAPPDGFDFRKFLDDAFERLRRNAAENLILDMRGNDGGESLGAEVAARLFTTPVRVDREVTAATNTLGPLRSFSRLDDAFISQFRDRLAPKEGRFEVRPESEPGFGLHTPAAAPFSGRVWVLTDGEVFSSATELTATLRAQRRAEFVGEETGGAYQGFSGGDFAVLTLPRSGVRVLLPLLRIDLATGADYAKGRGVIPEHPFSPTRADQIAGRDSELEYVKRLITTSRRTHLE